MPSVPNSVVKKIAKMGKWRKIKYMSLEELNFALRTCAVIVVRFFVCLLMSSNTSSLYIYLFSTSIFFFEGGPFYIMFPAYTTLQPKRAMSRRARAIARSVYAVLSTLILIC